MRLVWIVIVRNLMTVSKKSPLQASYNCYKIAHMLQRAETVGVNVVKVEIVKTRPDFTPHERNLLEKDGARVIRLFSGETLEFQIAQGRHFLYLAEDRDKIGFRDIKSRAMNVAVYPNFRRFFIEGSFDQKLAIQKDLLKKDAEHLRERLGLEKIGEILPEVSEATQAVFNYFDQTKIRLLGTLFKMLYIRTSTVTDKSGTFGALVGDWCDVAGLHVRSWPVNRKYPQVGVARWVVPIDGFEIKEEVVSSKMVPPEKSWDGY